MKLVSKRRMYRSVLSKACLAAMVLLNSCGSSPVGATEESDERADLAVVEVVAAKKGKLSSTVQLPGELLPYKEVDLYARETGFVKKLYVDVGSEVKEGELLLSLDAPELNSRLQEAQSVLHSRQALYVALKANYDRLYETSKTPGTISPNDLEQAKAQMNSQHAQVQAASSAYNQIVQTMKYLQVRAPFSGVICVRNINLGAYVGPSGKASEMPLLVLQQQKKLRLVVSVPEAYTGLLNKLDEVNFTVRSLPETTFTAKVSRMAGALDSRLRAERIEMDVYNDDKKLLPGMYAEVNLQLVPGDSTVIVPKTAVVSSTEKVFVVKVLQDKATWVGVKKGRESGGMVEIYGDVKPGDLVVKTATDEIRNGTEIKDVRVGE